MNKAIARIDWRSPEEGGRKTIPTGPKFICPARFISAWNAWPQEAWSLVLERLSNSGISKDWIAEVQFLVPEAPQKLLAEGAQFVLYEGEKNVASGMVLPFHPEPGAPENILLPA